LSWYFDSSALVKLVVREAESADLEAAIAQGDWQIATSALSVVEVGRAARRAGSRELAAANQILDEIDTLPLSLTVLRSAADLPPLLLRSLDAVHLASAVLLGGECEAVVTYDVRMQEAARGLGLEVRAPGQP
jgi:predicted nucleic acid-binding protein